MEATEVHHEERMEKALLAAREISPIVIAEEVEYQITNAWAGIEYDALFTEARTMIEQAQSVICDPNAIRDMLNAIDLRAIEADGRLFRKQHAVSSRLRHREIAVIRLRGIGLDEAFADINLSGCNEVEHWDWIITAPADELRAYRAEMLGGAA